MFSAYVLPVSLGLTLKNSVIF